MLDAKCRMPEKVFGILHFYNFSHTKCSHMKFVLSFFLILCVYSSVSAQTPKTYCNPMNLDYGYTPIPNFSERGRYRATADPVITYFKGDYYLFSTNQWGYWWSSDLNNWKFVPRLFLSHIIKYMTNSVLRLFLY